MEELNEFEQKCQDWLDTPKSERNLGVGAMLMLQANKNKILYQNAINKSMFDKIVYELQKYLGSKFRKCDAVTVEKLTEEIAVSGIEITAIESKGKRKDHDELPQEVQDIILTNSQRYARLRGLHERVKVLSGTGYTPCDRYPYLKEMLQLSTEIRNAWKFYDEFKVGDKLNIKAEDVKPIDAQRIGSNRVYIGRAIKEVPEKLKAGKLAAGNAQIAEAQIRYDELMLAGQEVKAETIEGLKAIGVIIQTIETKPEGGESGEQIKDPANPDIEAAKKSDLEETPERNLISQIKTLLNNGVTPDIVHKSIFSMGNFKGLELTEEVVSDLIKMTIEREAQSEVDAENTNLPEGEKQPEVDAENANLPEGEKQPEVDAENANLPEGEKLPEGDA